MANHIRFSETSIARIAAPTSGRATYRDKTHPGLELRVSTTGVKSWSTLHWLKGARRAGRETLGRWPNVSVKRASERARSYAGLVAERKNPGELRQALRREPSLGDVFELYFTDRKAAGKRRTSDMRAMWERWLGHMPDAPRKPHGRQRVKAPQGVDWSARRPSEIQSEECAALHTRIVRAGYSITANRVLELLSAVFGFAVRRRLTKENPAARIEPAPEVQRTRFLRTEELPAFFQALDATPQPWADLFRLALFVSYRRGALQAMRWQDIDLSAGMWHVPGEISKNGEPTVIPLTTPALKVIARRREETVPSAFVFPSAESKSGHIGGPKHQWARLLKRAGIADMRPHDLRRSLGSWLAMSGESLPMIGKALGHKDPQSTAIYARLQLHPVASAMERAAAAMLNTRTNVRILRRARS